MNSNSIEYHTKGYTRNFIYSDWHIFGLKTKYLKLGAILLTCAITLLIQIYLYSILHSVPLAGFYTPIIVGVLLAGFPVGLTITIFSIIAAYFFFPPATITNAYYVALATYFIQGFIVCFLLD